jgi:hypothetical protein
MKSKLSDSQEKEVVALYRQGKGSTFIAKEYSVSEPCIRRCLRRYSVEIKPPSGYRKYTINHKYFDLIDSEDKAYILGFFAADGYNNTTRGMIRIKLAIKDLPILDAISSKVGSNRPIATDFRSSENINWQDQSVLTINSRHLSQQLEKLGFGSNKTHLVKFPDYLPTHLESHFIRGVFDGDGSISHSLIKRKNEAYKQYAATITGNRPLVSRIGEILLNNNISSTLSKRHKERDNDIFTITVSGRLQIKRLYKYFYSGANLFLGRKKNGFNCSD